MSRTLVPPKDPKRRRRFFALKKLIKTAPYPQKLRLQAIARSLMERVDGDRLDGRPRPL